MLRRKHWGIGVGTLAGIAAIVGGCLLARRHGAPAAGVPKPGLAGGQQLPAPLTWLWEVGKTYEFRLDYDVDGRTNVSALVAAGPDAQSPGGLGAAAGAWQPSETHAQARLQVTPVTGLDGAESEGKTTARVELRDLVATSTIGGRTVEGVPPSGSTLTVTVDWAADGRISRLVFPGDASAYGRSLLRSVLGLIQVRFGAAGGDTWNVFESAPGGRYLAQYQVTAVAGDRVTIAKTFADPPGAAGSGGRHLGGSLFVVFGAKSGLPVSVSGKRETHVSLGALAIGNETAAVELRFVGASPIPAVAAVVGGRVSDLEGSDETALNRQGEWRRLAGDATLADLVGAIKGLPDGKMKDLQSAYQKLIAFLKLHPDRCLDVAHEFVSIDSDSAPFEALAMALTAAGGPEAQSALAQVITTDLAKDPRKAALLVPHLSMTDDPTAATAAFLHDQAAGNPDRSVRNTARLAQGTVAHQWLDAQPERSAGVVAELGESLASADAPSDTRLLLSSLGNIGYPSQTALIQPYVDSSDPSTREVAVHALRFVDTQEGRDLLEQKARTDASPAVRARALAALSFTPQVAQELGFYASVLKTDRAPAVVKEAAHNLALLARTDPAALALLKDYSGRCAQPDLCPYLQGLVVAAAASSPALP